MTQVGAIGGQLERGEISGEEADVAISAAMQKLDAANFEYSRGLRRRQRNVKLVLAATLLIVLVLGVLAYKMSG